MLDQALEALKTHDWGTDLAPLAGIDEAIVATHGNAAARSELEAKLAALLGGDLSRDAKDFVCRKLRLVGTAASVPALAALLTNPEMSHMSRYALENIPGAEAAAALRDALGHAAVAQKVGIIGSLGVRKDTASVPMLGKLLADQDAHLAVAAAQALGAIRSAEAASALAAAKPNDAAADGALDASLACAESMLKAGQKAGALAIYKAVSTKSSAKHVKLAATRGILACAGS